MPYREIPPPISLASGIECVWTRICASTTIEEAGCDTQSDVDAIVLEGGHINEVTAHTVLPDGAMDIIAALHADGSLDHAFVVGAMTQPIVSTLSNQSLVGIRFLPSVGGSALQINASELTNAQCALADLFPPKSPIFDALRALVVQPESAAAFRVFVDQLGVGRRSMPSLVRAATRQLAESPNRVRVENVARDLGVSRQHLARMFTSHSGLSPKQFATICRVRTLLAEVQHTMKVARVRSAGRTRKDNSAAGVERVRWSQVAEQYGYADQSHLIADVRAVTGLTPGVWERQGGSIIPILPVPVGAL